MKLDFPYSALLIIDVQYDFCPGGALGVEEGDLIIEPLNRLSCLFSGRQGRVIATQDWHPADHVSFASSHENKKPGDMVDLPAAKNQILWPDHCVQGCRGAELHEKLSIKPISLIIRKGFRRELDSYSAFFENDRRTPTGLDGFLKSLSITTVVLGGLATDYCVSYSAMDAKLLGYRTMVAVDAVRGVDYPKGSVEEALKNFEKASVDLISSEDLA